MNMKDRLKRVYTRAVWALTGLAEKRVVFTSFAGNSYSDNPKAISERLHELAPDLEIVWVSTHETLEGAPDYVRLVNRHKKLAYYRTLASAKVVVENFCFGNIPKKSGQVYIQTWHGDRAFKKVLYDSTFVDECFVAESQPDFCDLAVAGSDYGERQYRSAFRYGGEILKVGTPRDDILLHVTDELIRDKMKRIGIDETCRYLLYAPTLRRANQSSDVKQKIQGIDIRETLSKLEAQYGGEWKCLLRAHPSVSGLTGDGVRDQKVVDVSKYPDMVDLMIVADALITDYSSCAGDYALLRRPVFLFQDDIEEYLKKDRTFYFEMSDSPYLIAHSQTELNEIIEKTTLQAAADNCDEILKFYGTNECGDAAGAVAKRIIEYCNG